MRTSLERLFTLVLATMIGLGAARVDAQLLEQDQHTAQSTQHAMVVAGEPLAAKIGKETLLKGGNAVDASCAIGLALAVTLPRAGNLGGGGFALIRDSNGSVQALDFRETAPAALHRDFYSQARFSSRTGPTAAGVPGTVSGLWAMHDRYGKLPWKDIVEPAIKLASQGFPVTPWLHDGLTKSADKFRSYPSSHALFLPEGKPPQIGTNFVQEDLARTLRRLQRSGPKDFYQGKTARILVSSMQKAGGVITLKDMANYRSVWRNPVSGSFRGHRVYSMPPPSSGGIHLIQMLTMLESFETAPDHHNSSKDLHQIAEVMRLAYADRAKYLGDPDFVDVPTRKLLSKAYLDGRAALITDRAGDSKALAPELFNSTKAESPDTTHYSVVDKNGMAVSLTYTLNFSYGSGYVAEGTGILMNNEMDDFSLSPGQPNGYGLIGGEANSVQAGKRPLSSMTPVIVTKEGEFFATFGAPGGSRIITGVTQAVLNTIGYGFNAQMSVALPRIHHQWYPDQLRYEVGISKDTRIHLASLGHKLKKIYAVAHVLSIVRDREGHLEAGLDPRRPAAMEGY